MAIVNGPLQQNFQAFYYEVLRQKEKALRLSLPDDMSENAVNPVLIEDIQNRLRSILQEQALKMEHAVGVGNSVYFRDAQYLMAALADEIFLNLNWPGVKSWEKYLLEAQLFQTQVAGELIFKKLDALLESSDPMREELASLYFMVLSLGFRGKYQDTKDDQKIKWYLGHLYRIVQHQPSHLFRPGRPHLINQCYEYTLTDSPGRGLPDNRLWVLTLGSLVVLYIFITYVVWYRLASEVHEALNLIFEQTRQNPLL